MPTRKSPRKGSLQFWPRKRARKFLPSVNWDVISSGKNLNGFLCYKAGMVSVSAKDNTPNSLMKGKKIVIPCTILECPPMKILSIRFYKNGNVVNEFLVENIDKELKRTGIKKTPDLSEIGLSGTLDEKINFVRENLIKEISVLDVFEKGQLVDLRGLTKGQGLQGPVKRFGITLKSHKSEKGRRRPGSL